MTPTLAEKQETRFQQLNQQGEDQKILGLTPSQIQYYLSLSTGAGLSAAGLAALFYSAAITISIIPVTAGLLALTVGAVFFFLSTQCYDYSDPAQLSLYREQARETFKNFKFLEEQLNEELKQQAKNLIHEIAKEHGWENMFYYGIPTPVDFKEIYQFCTSHMTIYEEIELYKVVTDEYDKAQEIHGEPITFFEVPHPSSSKAKFYREISNQSFGKIVKNYNFELLAEYRMLDQQFSEIYQNYQRIKGEFCSKPEHQQYDALRLPHKQAYSRKLSIIGENFSSNATTTKLNELYQKEVVEVGVYRRERDERIARFREGFEGFANALTDFGRYNLEDLSLENQKLYDHEKSKSNREIKQITEQYQPIFDEIKRKYIFLRGDLVQESNQELNERNKKLLAAKRIYKASVTPLKERRDQVIGTNLVLRYQESLQRLDEEFHHYIETQLDEIS